MGPGANEQPWKVDSASRFQAETIVIRFEVVVTKHAKVLRSLVSQSW